MTACRMLIKLDWDHLQDIMSLELMLAIHFDLINSFLFKLDNFGAFATFAVFTVATLV